MKKKTDEQLRQAIEACERRVTTLRAAISRGYKTFFANELKDLEYQIQKELKEQKHWKTMLKNRVASRVA